MYQYCLFTALLTSLLSWGIVHVCQNSFQSFSTSFHVTAPYPCFCWNNAPGYRICVTCHHAKVVSHIKYDATIIHIYIFFLFIKMFYSKRRLLKGINHPRETVSVWFHLEPLVRDTDIVMLKICPLACRIVTYEPGLHKLHKHPPPWGACLFIFGFYHVL